MKNLKNLNGLVYFIIVITFLTVFSTQDVVAQQGFSTMTVSTDGTTLTTKSRDLANGTNINTVDGPKYFGSSSNNGTIRIYNQDTNTRYGPGNRLGGNTNTTNSDESVGPSTASYFDSVINSAPFFKDQNNSANTIPITATRNAPNGTINGVPSSSPREILKMEYILNNIDLLPDNTRIFINSRQGNLSTGGSRNGIADGIKKVGGTRTEPTTDPRGQQLNNQGPTLGLENPISIGDNASLTNNPTKDFFVINDGLAEVNIFDVDIFNVTGAIVQVVKQYQEGTDISVVNLAVGMYLVEVKSKDGKFVKKLIKK